MDGGPWAMIAVLSSFAPVQDSSLELHARLRAEDGSRSVEYLSDLTVTLSLSHPPRETLRLALPPANTGGSWGPLDFFDLEIEDAAGVMLRAPEGRVRASVGGRTFLPYHSILEQFVGSTERRWSLAEFGAWGVVVLEPGPYRLRAVYRGLPDLGGREALLDMAGVWRGEIRSDWTEFTITEPTTSWSPGAEVGGLVASLGTETRPTRFLEGEWVRARVRLENRGTEPFEFTRPLPDWTKDVLHFAHESAKGDNEAHGFKSGAIPVLDLRLAPGESAVFLLPPLQVRTSAELLAGRSPWFLAGPPGKYQVSVDVRMLRNVESTTWRWSSLRTGEQTWRIETR